MESNKYLQTIESSKVSADDAAVKAAVNELLEKHCAENATNEV